MKIENCFKEFINYLESEKNISKYTKENYASDMKIFVLYLQSSEIQTDIEVITTPILRQYFTYLKTVKNYKNPSMRRKIHSLSSFFKFLVEQEYLIKNPMSPIHAPKLESKLPIYLHANEVERLIKSVSQYGHDRALHDKCFIKMLAYTGVRRCEIIAMNFDDVDFNRQTIKIRGKGNKERLLPMPDSLCTDLWAYLQTRLPLSNPAIFLSKADNRISTSPANNLFKKYVNKAGLGNRNITMHKMRHSYASLLVQNNADFISVSKLLGHSDINSTKIYTHVDTNHLRKQMDKLPFK